MSSLTLRAQAFGPLQKVEWTIPEGVSAIVGPNRVGKSTLLAVLAGDLEPDRGTVELDGATLRSWTQVETGSAITWKYPSCILQGDDSVGEFYSVALSNHRQQADTGTKMIHLGKRTRSTIVSKGISAGHGRQTYRGGVTIAKSAEGARNYTQCDSLLIGDKCAAHTVPYVDVKNPTAKVEHEATTTRISEERLFYCQQRGIDPQEATALIVGGFCQAVLEELPMEFALEAKALLAVSLEGAVG